MAFALFSAAIILFVIIESARKVAALGPFETYFKECLSSYEIFSGIKDELHQFVALQMVWQILFELAVDGLVALFVWRAWRVRAWLDAGSEADAEDKAAVEGEVPEVPADTYPEDVEAKQAQPGAGQNAAEGELAEANTSRNLMAAGESEGPVPAGEGSDAVAVD